ncbi:MAG: hypothetical protein ACRDNL_29525 [Spirillospora sp.]
MSDGEEAKVRDEQSGGLGHGVRRLCVAVGRERVGHGLAEESADNAMARILHHAEADGGLQRAQWVRHPQARIALLPPGIDEARVIAVLVRYLRESVYRHNKVSAPPARLKLRVAAHEGLTHVQDEMYVGDVIDTTAALVSEASFTTRAGAADVAVAVTDRIYGDVIRGRETYDLRPEDFTELRTGHGTAWVHVAAVLTDPDPPAERGSAPSGADEGGSVSIRTGGRLRVGDFAGRDIDRSRGPGRSGDGSGGPDVRIEAGEAEFDRFAGRDLIEEPGDDRHA